MQVTKGWVPSFRKYRMVRKGLLRITVKLCVLSAKEAHQLASLAEFQLKLEQ